MLANMFYLFRAHDFWWLFLILCFLLGLWYAFMKWHAQVEDDVVSEGEKLRRRRRELEMKCDRLAKQASDGTKEPAPAQAPAQAPDQAPAAAEATETATGTSRAVQSKNVETPAARQDATLQAPDPEADPAAGKQEEPASAKTTPAKKAAPKKVAAQKVSAKKAPAKKAAAQKVSAKKAPAKKAPKKTAKKTSTRAKSTPAKKTKKSTTAKTTAAKSIPAKKATTAKPAGKKASASKPPAKKASASKPPAKKASASKPPAKKASASKPPAKKASASKPPAKKASASKPPAKEASASKPPAKKGAASKSGLKKTAAKPAFQAKKPATKNTPLSAILTKQFDGETVRNDERLGVLYEKAPKVTDDLTQIKGVGKVIETKLHAFGVYRFKQIASWKPAQVEAFTEELATFKDRIDRDGWVKQAKKLAK